MIPFIQLPRQLIGPETQGAVILLNVLLTWVFSFTFFATGIAFICVGYRAKKRCFKTKAKKAIRQGIFSLALIAPTIYLGLLFIVPLIVARIIYAEYRLRKFL